MNKKVSNKMKIIMKKNGSLRTCIFYEVLAALNIGLSFFTGYISAVAVAFNIFTLITIGNNYPIARRAVERDDYRDEHKEEYEDLKALYDMYIDEIVRLIKKHDFEDELQLCVLLDCFLFNGLFSYNNQYKHKHFDEVNEYFLDMLGSFVITGNAVCRHTTSFMIDILKKLDIECYEVICSTIGNKPDHEVVGINCNNKKFCYDFTNHYFGIIRDNYIYSIPGNDEKYKIYGISIPKKEFDNITSYELDDDIAMKYYKNINKYDCNLVNNFELFSYLSNGIKKEISEKTLKLMPRK